MLVCSNSIPGNSVHTTPPEVVEVMLDDLNGQMSQMVYLNEPN